MKTYLHPTLQLLAVLLLAVSAVNAASKKPTVTHFAGHGVEFDHDPKLKVEAEKSDNGVTLNLTGYKGLVFTVQLATLPLSGDDYAKSILTGMHDGMAKGGGSVQEIETVRTTIGGRERQGRAFKYKLIGSEFYYQAYGWDLKSVGDQKKLTFLAIQYQPKNEKALKPLLETVLESFKITQE